MRKLSLRVSLVVMATALMSVVSASVYAQEHEIDVKVPFAFVVADSRLSAGEYIVRETETPGVLAIASKDRRQSVFVLTEAGPSGKADAPAGLVFKRYGNEYFLAQFIPGGGDDGREVPLTPSILEHELAATASNP